jgi:alpha-mannosidase
MPPSELKQTLSRLGGRLLELSAWQDNEVLKLGDTKFRADQRSDWITIRTGDLWPQLATPIWLRFDVSIPQDWHGLPVHSRFALGGEALLSLNGRPLGGLNSFHREHPLSTSAVGGETLVLEAEVVPHGLFGTPSLRPRIEEAALLIPDLDVRALLEDLAAALDVANYLQSVEREDVSERVADALQRAVRRIRLPRDQTEPYLTRLASGSRQTSLEGFSDNQESLTSLWEDYMFTAQPARFSEEARRELRNVRTDFAAEVEKIRDIYPPIGKVWLTGHAHLDLAWLWPLEETRRKARRTFLTVTGLMDRYPEFHFNQSSAQSYAWIEEDDPVLFARIQTYVAEGRWEVIGGMWVEPDGNLPAGESWVRQLLFGQRFFQSRFGQRSRVAWLPDSFGFTGNLPQLLRSAGLTFFFTHKLTWNERNEFPYDLYWWEGIDGSRVLAHSFRNPSHGYNARLEAFDLGETWRNFKGKRYAQTTLLAFGYGDGGGGPTTEMLERFARLQNFPAMPRLCMGRVSDFYEGATCDPLPVWVGEQYLEYHRATFTTQAKVKALHRQLEHTIVNCEAAAALALLARAEPYPKDDLQQIWRTLLLNEFHDILPGSSIHTVYEAVHEQLGNALRQAENLCDQSLRALSGRAATDPLGLTIWNFQVYARPLVLELAKPAEGQFKLLTAEAAEIPYQEISPGKILAVAAGTSVPPLGSVILTVAAGRPSQPSTTVRATVSELENEGLKIFVNSDGSLASVYDKEQRREALSDRGNQLWVFTDIPRQFDAWDIDASYTDEGVELLAEEPAQVVESGPLRATLRVIRSFESSNIIQEYSLTQGGRQLTITNFVQWSGRRRLLRALFPLKIRSHEFWTETAFGAVARPTYRNTPWDQAKFEVPGHRWADLSEPEFGISLLTDCKYGYSAHLNVLGVTLLRSPIYPDPYADEGEHEFSYALFPHPGDWRNGTVRAAQDLNEPLRVVAAVSNTGQTASLSWRLSGGNLELACLKKAEDSDELILRLYEPHGNRGVASLEVLGLPLHAAFLTNILEDAENSLAIDHNGRIDLEFAPFQILTLRLRFG